MSAQHTAPPAAEGTWDLIVDTPIGKQHSRVVLSRTADGTWRGTALDRASGEEVPLTEITVEDAEVTWRQSITRPLRLHLTVRLTLSGDELTGKAKAGRLPASKVTGRRGADTDQREHGAH
jgi:hypothetical protein